MSTVGNNILTLRKQLGLTQEELAKKMGYKSKSTINKIELGINDIPQSKIVKFAEVLGTTPAFLMGWNDDETSSLEEPTLTEGEKVWLELYNKISQETREVLIDVAIKFDKLPADTQNFLLGAIRVALKNQK